VAGSEGGRPVIAVLPFTNLTNDPAQDSFCYGLTEEITNGLAGMSSIDVVASSSTFQFKDEPFDVREVGRELGVPFILEGSVRMEEGHTRVIAQLARSNDGVAVWSDSFDDQMNGSLNTQKSIARKVMDTLPLDSPVAS
jgi:TolB-like protein